MNAVSVRTLLESLLAVSTILGRCDVIITLSTTLPAQLAHVVGEGVVAVALALPLNTLGAHVDTLALSAALGTVLGHPLPVIVALTGISGGPLSTSGVGVLADLVTTIILGRIHIIASLIRTIVLLSGGLEPGSESGVGDVTHVTSGDSEITTLSPAATPAVLHSEEILGVSNTGDSMTSSGAVSSLVDTSLVSHEVTGNLETHRKGP